MHAPMVNAAIASIFNRFLESWNLAENAKRFAKMRGRKISGSAVYYPGINYSTALRRAHFSALVHSLASQRPRKAPQHHSREGAREKIAGLIETL
jgi:hypothetical protein